MEICGKYSSVNHALTCLYCSCASPDCSAYRCSLKNTNLGNSLVRVSVMLTDLSAVQMFIEEHWFWQPLSYMKMVVLTVLLANGSRNWFIAYVVLQLLITFE